MRGRKPSCSIVFTAVSIIEKEKSPWGDENIGHTCYMRLTHNRKREIPVRGRKQSQHSIKSHLFYRKREIPVRGRKLHYVSWLDFEICIEKEKSPWGDENWLGAKLYKFFSFAIEKEKSPWGDENVIVGIVSLLSILIEKEKSPWGDENKSIDRQLSHSSDRKREIPVRGRKV